MKKTKLLLLALTIILSSCHDGDSFMTTSQNLSEETNSTSLSFDSIDSQSDTTLSTSSWSSEVHAAMLLILGEDLPYLSVFDNDYLYVTGTIYQSTIPYINIYFKNRPNWSSQYATLLLQNNYLYDGSEADESTGDVWEYYYKNISDNSVLEVKFAYYYSEGDAYFDIYAYIEGDIPGEEEIPVDYDYIIEPSHFGNKGYPENNTDLNINHQLDSRVLALTYKNIMNQNMSIQFKNNMGVLNNKTAIENLKFLYLDSLTDFNRIIVEKGTSLTNMSVVASYNNLYDLQGATFFRIKSSGNGVVSMTSIQLFLK